MEKCCCFTLPKTKGQSFAPKKLEVVSLCHHFPAVCLLLGVLLQVSWPLKYVFTGCYYCRIWTRKQHCSPCIATSVLFEVDFETLKNNDLDSKYLLKTLLQQYWCLWSINRILTIQSQTYLCIRYASSNEMYGMYNEENMKCYLSIWVYINTPTFLQTHMQVSYIHVARHDIYFLYLQYSAQSTKYKDHD